MKNEYRIENDACIMLINGKEVIIDKEDMSKIGKYKWLISKRNEIFTNHNYSRFYLCHFLLNVTEKKCKVNHKNNNFLDCRKDNIYFVRSNTYEIIDDTVKVTVSNGKSFLISSEDFDKVKQYGWLINARNCIYTNIEKKRVQLCKYLLNIKHSKVKIIRKNNNPLDCRRSNLKIEGLNSYEFYDTYTKIITSKNEEILVDNEDFDKVKDYTWNLNSYGYATARGKTQNCVLIHRLIMNLSNTDLQVDHINHNKLDNRKYNLRTCTLQQNNWNKKPKYRGYYQKGNIWVAHIYVNKKDILLGWFDSEEKAKKAREEAEIEYFGEFRYKGDDICQL